MAQTLNNSLASMMKPTPSMLGSGQANLAAQALKDREYQMHVKECKDTQTEPLEYNEWLKQQKGKS
jgi:hypothetical protein